MTLIADCGGSSSNWALCDSGIKAIILKTDAIHALHMTTERISEILREELAPQITQYIDKVDEIYFYGAGVIDNSVRRNVAHALKSVFDDAVIEVDTDLVGAARALCQREAGIACIIGTGSNSCFYDGESVIANVAPLGYILGDEGSGAVLGRMLIADVLKNQLPESIASKFMTQYDLDYGTIIRRVYREPEANKFMASFVPFLKENIECIELHTLVVNAFRSFFTRNVAQYPNAKKAPINFIGSVAYHFASQLKEAAEIEGFTVGKIEASPLPGLITLHNN